MGLFSRKSSKSSESAESVTTRLVDQALELKHQTAHKVAEGWRQEAHRAYVYAERAADHGNDLDIALTHIALEQADQAYGDAIAESERWYQRRYHR